VGGWLAERWNLPDHLVEAIRLHHQPGKAGENKDLVSLIHCADVCALRLAEKAVEFDKGLDFDKDVLARFQAIDPGFADAFRAQGVEEIPAEFERATTIHERA
jgi:HD-like signal output (HDOD) protein